MTGLKRKKVLGKKATEVLLGIEKDDFDWIGIYGKVATGVINMRGEVIPVIDLRRRFGLPEAERTDECRIIIVEVEERMVGLIVDSVSEVLSLPNEQIQEAPSQVAGGKTDLIKGVGKIDDRMLIILDLDRILTSDEQVALDDISRAGKGLAAGQ